ncbi:MAG: endonuclease/exonuclease/phosphatase family protein [Gemmatimonadota bacterium]|nr:MAG: endonuclease/exonuclease/phosphatase family protein [Gemmatimonadota bacterium]
MHGSDSSTSRWIYALERNRRRRGRRCVLASFSLAAAAVSCTAAPLDADLELRVMTFNIRYGTARDGDNSWPHRSRLVLDVINGYAPDILGTQEALQFQIDELQQGLDGYGVIGVGREDGVAAGEYAAILYRTSRFEVTQSGTFWFSDTPDVPGSVSWGNNVTRICTWALFSEKTTGQQFFIYNVHFDHESQPSRERSAGLLAARIAARSSPAPFVVTGDFNAGEENPAMRFLLGEIRETDAEHESPAISPGLRDSYRVLHPDSIDVGTFNAFRGERSGEKIDAVLVSSQWQVTAAAITRASAGGRYPSDHFPVVATISLEGTAAQR